VHAEWERMWKDSDNQEVGLEAAILQRKRNSSLVESICAENSTGLSMPPKLRIRIRLRAFPSGRGAFHKPVKRDRKDAWRKWKSLCRH